MKLIACLRLQHRCAWFQSYPQTCLQCSRGCSHLLCSLVCNGGAQTESHLSVLRGRCIKCKCAASTCGFAAIKWAQSPAQGQPAATIQMLCKACQRAADAKRQSQVYLSFPISANHANMSRGMPRSSDSILHAACILSCTQTACLAQTCHVCCTCVVGPQALCLL